MNEQAIFLPSAVECEADEGRHGKKRLSKIFVALAGSVFWGGLVAGPLGATPVPVPESQRQDTGQNTTITNNAQSIFIGEDAETGDRVIRVTPPRQPETSQPYIPYVIPEVAVPWPSGGGQAYPPTGGDTGGQYPPPRPDRPMPPGSWPPGSPAPWPGRPPYPGAGESGAPSPSTPSVRPPYPGRPDQSVRPPAGGNWGIPPYHGTPWPDAGRPERPGGPSAWRPQWVPGPNGMPNSGGAFVYQPGRELPRFPANNHPYAPLGPSGPIVLPPNRR